MATKQVKSAPAATKPQVSVFVLGAQGGIALANAMDARKGARASVKAARESFDKDIRPKLEAAGVKFDTDSMEAARKATQATVYRIYGVAQGSKDRTKPLPAKDPWGELIGSITVALYPQWKGTDVAALRDGDKAARDTAMKAIKRVVTAMAPIKTGTKSAKTGTEMAEAAAARIAKDAANINPRQVPKIVQAFQDALRDALAKPAKVPDATL